MISNIINNRKIREVSEDTSLRQFVQNHDVTPSSFKYDDGETLVGYIPTITRDIDTLMTSFLLLDRRVPRSIDVEQNGRFVTYTYRIQGEEYNVNGVMEFPKSQDPITVELKMVGRLIFGVFKSFWGMKDPDKFADLFDDVIGRLKLRDGELSIIRDQFMEDLQTLIT